MISKHDPLETDELLHTQRSPRAIDDFCQWYSSMDCLSCRNPISYSRFLSEPLLVRLMLAFLVAFAQWHAVKPELLLKPWGEACIAAQGYLPICFKIEANSKVSLEGAKLSRSVSFLWGEILRDLVKMVCIFTISSTCYVRSTGCSIFASNDW